jgi:hypothetical protein
VPPLAETQEHGEQTGGHQQPVRGRHRDRERAGQHAQDVEGADREDVHDRDVLQPERVHDREAEVAGETRHELRPEWRHQRERAEREAGRERRGAPNAQRARRERSASLQRVPAVGLAIGKVVPHIACARGEAEGARRDERAHDRLEIEELRAEQQRREHQRVLHPFARTQQREERSHLAACRPRCRVQARSSQMGASSSSERPPETGPRSRVGAPPAQAPGSTCQGSWN